MSHTVVYESYDGWRNEAHHGDDGYIVRVPADPEPPKPKHYPHAQPTPKPVESRIGEVSMDFETRSTVDLKKSGVYVYAEHESTDVLCLAFKSPEDIAVSLWTPADALFDTDVHRRLCDIASSSRGCRAWNAAFERIIWREIMVKRYGLPEVTLERWVCTAAEAAALSLPRALENAARVLAVSEQKDMEGSRLMLQMARPRNAAARKKDPTIKPTWWEDQDKKARLYHYCEQDVRTELAVAQKIRRLTPSEREAYLLDQRINDRGIMIDEPLIGTMQKMGDEATRRANAELRQWTKGKVESVTKPRDIVAWLNELQFDEDEVLSIAKDKIDLLLANENLPDAAREVLNLRVQAGKSSVSKLKRMLEFACRDKRMRGLLLFHGAGTGRWAGKGPQIQNFPSRSWMLSVDKDVVAKMLPIVRAAGFDEIDLIWPVLEVLSLCLRACLRAAPGKKFVGGDFSQIEARVLAWLAGQKDLLHRFSEKQDVYKPMAAAIYKVAVELVTKAQRDMGKRAILGCGFGMGWEKFIATSWKEARQIIDEEFSRNVIETYREQNDCIVAFWYELNDAAIRAVRLNGEKVYTAGGKLVFAKRGDYLWIRLPSGKRMLAYYKPEIRQMLTPWGAMKDTVVFWGENQKRQWVRLKSYGGLWAENVTQATARDLMLEAIFRTEEAGYPCVGTVHDQLLAEVDEDFGSAQEYESLMCERSAWAEDIPVAAECEETLCFGK
jgi:DNA polymerase bacteriophage-type